MALHLEFNCTQCEYSVFMAGRPSVTMAGPTVPIQCIKCNEIEDRLEEHWMDDGNIGIDPECGECGNRTFTFWNWKKKPCPKCKEGTLVEDWNGVMADVD